MILVFGMVWDAQLDNLILLSFFLREQSYSSEYHYPYPCINIKKYPYQKKISKNIRTIQWALVIYCLAFIGKQPRMPPTSFEVILCRK